MYRGALLVGLFLASAFAPSIPLQGLRPEIADVLVAEGRLAVDAPRPSYGRLLIVVSPACPLVLVLVLGLDTSVSYFLPPLSVYILRCFTELFHHLQLSPLQ